MSDLILSENTDFLQSLDPDSIIKIERPFESLQDYYKINRLSHSRMVRFRQSPRHYLYSLNHFEETPAMILGRAFHAIVLEEENFDEMFYLLDLTLRKDMSKGMTSNINKQWKAEIQASNHGKTFLTEEQYSTIRYMRDALYRDEKSNELFQEVGEVEKEIFWTDPITGIQIKMKLDAIADDFTLDLKSCMNAKPEVFKNHAWDMEYHGQAGLYSKGRPLGRDRNGKKLHLKEGKFYFIAVEKEPPYGVSVNRCSRKFISKGVELYSQTLSDFAYWQEMGAPDVCYEWRKPMGYSTLDAPYWVR